MPQGRGQLDVEDRAPLLTQPAASSSLRILVVDDDPNIRLTLSMCLEDGGHEVIAHGTIDEALTAASRRAFDLVFLDVRLGMDNGLDFIGQLLAQSPWARVVVITAYASIATAVRAMKEGATDYLAKPFTPAQVQTVTQRVAERRRLEWKIQALQAALGDDPEAEFPTNNAQMQRAIDMARQAADSRATILIEGELGTGKGRLARAICAWSGRRDGPYAFVSCDTTSAEALEAELFGTVALGQNSATLEMPGKLALCEGGTLVLEQVGQCPPSLTQKLLLLLRDKEYERQNDFKLRKADVRIIATTSFALQQAVERRRFSPDLLLALEVVKIQVPALRQRPEDIPMLARRYLAYFARENHRPIIDFTGDAMHAIRQHKWPGNVRELRNVIERAVLACNEAEISIKHLPPDLLGGGTGSWTIGDLVPLETIEGMHIRGVLAAAGSIRGAAGVLGVHENTLSRWLRKNGNAGTVNPAAQAGTGTISEGTADDQPAT